MKKTAFQVFALVLALAGSSTVLAGPYAPAAGQAGSTAAPQDSPEFVAWASGYLDYIVGTDVDSTWRTPEKALGPAVGDSFDIVCLGNGGRITLTFDPPIANGQGWDFAVFENSFSDTFLELAYVEVSSDGTTFVRFDSDSLTAAPVGGFGSIDPTNINGLASKYRQGFGTPFDLSDLASKPEVLSGAVDLSALTHMRLVDIIGNGASFDTSGDVIYDPHPTVASGGFDLDAVGVRYVLSPNAPPAQPRLVYPPEAAVSVPLNVALQAGPFSDPDEEAGDFHFRTRWQIATDPGFNELRLDLTSPFALTELLLSEAVLSPGTVYYWRVQYVDGRGDASSWSEAFSFTTVASTQDANGNGIPDGQELEPGSPIDLNGDRVPDATQVNERFKVLKSAVGAGQMAVAVSGSGTVIEFIEAVDSGDYPEGAGKPEDTLLGLLNLKLRVPNSGDSETLTVYLSEPAPDGYQWFKYDAIRGWRTVADAVFSADRRVVTLSVADGGSADGDGRADGVILDPGGVGLAAGGGSVDPPPSGKAGVGGGGCFIATAGKGSAGEPRAFTDQLGRRLLVPDDPQRVVALAESVTEIVFAVGRGGRLVGTTRFADYPQAALKLPRIGSYIQLDIERIAALEPDLCIGTRDGNPKAAVDRLDALGIPVYISNPMGIESILQSITEIGALLRAEEAAGALVAELRRRIAAVAEFARRSDTCPRVFFQIGVDPVVSAGRGTFIHELIEAAGGVNAAGEAAGYPKYSPEHLVRLAPDVVVITTMSQGADFDAVRREWLRWPRIPAVRDGRVHVVDAAVFNRPAPRLIDGLEVLARLIHSKPSDSRP